MPTPTDYAKVFAWLSKQAATSENAVEAAATEEAEKKKTDKGQPASPAATPIGKPAEAPADKEPKPEDKTFEEPPTPKAEPANPPPYADTPSLTSAEKYRRAGYTPISASGWLASGQAPTPQMFASGYGSAWGGQGQAPLPGAASAAASRTSGQNKAVKDFYSRPRPQASTTVASSVDATDQQELDAIAKDSTLTPEERAAKTAAKQSEIKARKEAAAKKTQEAAQAQQPAPAT